ncbi:hypothetical protein V6N13_023428 [Hibiscus sabdariffa]
MEDYLAQLTIDSGEGDAIPVGHGEENPIVSFNLCFVGTFLTTSIVNFQSMRATLANVLVHDIPPGLLSTRLAKLLGDFIGDFIDYDSSAISLGYKGTMRIKVLCDVRLSLKRCKKLALPGGNTHIVRFEYERLTLFCFICDKLGHGDSFCPIHAMVDPQKIVFGWDNSIRAPSRRSALQRSDWLKEETLFGSHSSDLFKGVKGGTSHAGSPAQGVVGGGDDAPLFPLANLIARINPANNFSGQDSRKSVHYSPISPFTNMIPARLPLIPTSFNDINMTAVGEQNPIVPSEGIKRPRVQPHLSDVSIAADSLVSSDHPSAGLAQQASRSQ